MVTYDTPFTQIVVQIEIQALSSGDFGDAMRRNAFRSRLQIHPE
jgi:hypothetical protein